MKFPGRMPMPLRLMLLILCVLAVRAGAQPTGRISRNVYRIPWANSVVVKFNRSADYYGHNGSMDTSGISCVSVAAAATVCSSDADCATVGGTCISGYCIDNLCDVCETTDGIGACDYVLVAPADGIICRVIEHYNDCGCNRSAFGSFGNGLAILHANGEMSAFLHVKQWSASFFGITPGMFVTQGQPIAIEGDVGNTCGETDSVRTGTCRLSDPNVPALACKDVFPFVECRDDTDCDGGVCTSGMCAGGVRPGDTCTTTSDCNPKCRSTACGRHAHWNIQKYTTGELMNPLTCGIPGNLYEADSVYQAPCGTSPNSYNQNENLSQVNLNGLARTQAKVLQAINSITASTVVVRNQASLVLHAGSKVQLLPGFHAYGDGYFRAEIARPDTTAPSTWPMPDDCPCTGVMRLCYQWSDPTSPNTDGIEQGCTPIGPAANFCDGCPTSIGGSGGVQCCPCVAADTCEN